MKISLEDVRKMRFSFRWIQNHREMKGREKFYIHILVASRSYFYSASRTTFPALK